MNHVFGELGIRFWVISSIQAFLLVRLTEVWRKSKQKEKKKRERKSHEIPRQCAWVSHEYSRNKFSLCWPVHERSSSLSIQVLFNEQQSQYVKLDVVTLGLRAQKLQCMEGYGTTPSAGPHPFHFLKPCQVSGLLRLDKGTELQAITGPSFRLHSVGNPSASPHVFSIFKVNWSALWKLFVCFCLFVLTSKQTHQRTNLFLCGQDCFINGEDVISGRGIA